MKKILQFIESGFVIISLIFYSGGILGVILSGGLSQGDLQQVQHSDAGLIRLAFILIYLGTFFLLMFRWKKFLYLASRNMLIWLLIGYTMSSVFWSFAPEVTLRRTIALNGTTLFGIYLSSQYSIKQQLEILAGTFGIIILLSFLFGIALPKYGIMGGGHAGAWRGVYIHKNLLGKNMVLSALVFLLLAVSSNKNRLFLWCGFYCSIILLLLSTSTSSLVNLFIITALFLICQVCRLRFAIMLPLLISILIAGVWINLWLINQADFLLGFLGKDATLTGRTELWQLTWQSIQKEYWLGYGYGAFWSEENSEASIIYNILQWIAPHAHNGLLELWVNLGLLGVTIYLLGFSTTFIKAIIQICLNKQWEFYWILLLFSYNILANLTEHTMLRENNIFWILYIAAFFSIGLLQTKNKLLEREEMR